jgi:hypothetical protein
MKPIALAKGPFRLAQQSSLTMGQELRHRMG